MIRRIALISALFLNAALALAQGGIPLLDKAAGKHVTFRYSYSLSRGGADFSPVTEGDVVVEGNSYILRGLGLEVRSDGVTRWTIDGEAREVLVETVAEDDIFTNPALFLSSYRKYSGSIKVNGSGDDFLDVTLTLDDETLARFVLTGVEFDAGQKESGFSIDEKSLPDDYIVTDLR